MLLLYPYIFGYTPVLRDYKPYKNHLYFCTFLLTKIYGQYYYADLTRDGNIKKKDELEGASKGYSYVWWH